MWAALIFGLGAAVSGAGAPVWIAAVGLWSAAWLLTYLYSWRVGVSLTAAVLPLAWFAEPSAPSIPLFAFAFASALPIAIVEHSRRGSQWLRDAIDSSAEIIFAQDRRRRFAVINAAAARLIGRPPEHILGKTVDEVALPAEMHTLFRTDAGQAPDRSTEVIVDPDNRVRVFLTARSAVRDASGNVRGSMAIARDIGAGVEFSPPSASPLHHDPLTGLPNRRFVTELTTAAIQRGESVAALWIGLDRFKIPNDALGHAAGDKILIEAAHRLVGCLRGSGSVARIGSDEFVILIEKAADAGEARQTGSRVLRELSRSFTLDGLDLRLSAGIGMALAPAGGGIDARRLLGNAAIAMRHAKTSGAGTICEFDEAMRDDAGRRLNIEVELRRALAASELAVFFQPILSLRDRGIAGFEALLRWRHPRRGLLPPSEFLAAAEETRLIVPIGWFMIRQSLEWTARLNRTLGHRKMTISLNLSEIQFAQPDLLHTLRGAVAESGVDPAQICLELTESVVATPSPAFLSTVVELKRAGFRIAVDDFGVGYSSLSRIHHLPVDTLKIDREFVRRMHHGENDFAMVRTIVGMAGGLKMESVAEGIETEQQADTLRELGCAYGQGFLFGRPVEPEQALALAVQNAS